MTRERRLGRGLEALLGRLPRSVEAPIPATGPYGAATEELYGIHGMPPQAPPAVQSPGPAAHDPAAQQPAPTAMPTQAESVPGMRRIDVHRIERNPYQPRQDFDPAETQSLADSLKAHGLLQPVVVRQVGDRYQVIAGERRFQAAVQAGWTDVPANVIEADDRQTAELAIIENLQRKDLNPLEKAAAFHAYLEQYRCTQEDLASRLHLDRSTIANLIRLLELPEAVRDAVRQGRITQGHARALLPLGDEREQIEFCDRIQREGLNVRQTESMVQETVAAADGQPLAVIGRDGRPSRPGRVQSEHVAALEQEFRAALGVRVTIVHNARGRGRLTIHFRNHEEFERLRLHLTDPGRPGAQAHAG